MNRKRFHSFAFLPLIVIGSGGVVLIIVGLAAVLAAVGRVACKLCKHRQSTREEINRVLLLNQQLLDISFLNTVAIDAAGTIRQINSPCLKELKLEAGEAVGKPVAAVFDVHKDKQSLLHSIFEELKAGKATIDLPPSSVVHNVRSNSNFMVEGTFIGTYHKEELAGAIFLFRNIDRELTREYVLNMSLSRTKIFPWFYDMEKGRMDIDSRWFHHLGLPEGDATLSGEEFAALLHPDDRDGIISALSQQLAGSLNTEVVTYRLLRGDGTWEWFEAQSIYLGRVADTPYRVVGVCQSIQDHKNTEQKLIDARNKAEESDMLKSAFLANMSHEIRTPLNAIVGFSSIIAGMYTDLGEQDIKEYASMIEKNSQLLILLISDILDLAKIESNTMEFHLQPVSLNALMAEVSQTQRLNIKEGVEFVMDVPATDTVISSDALRLGQVMNNLINNAIKFTSKGGIRFGYRLVGKKAVELFVEDTGIGMTEEVVSRMFERFFKGDSFVQGTGLGLAICKVIVEHFDGEISVESKVGEGTSFTVKLPV